MEKRKKPYIFWFGEISINDISLVGGKNASLGEMYSKLSKKRVQIPDGFAITSFAFWHFLEKNKIKEKIKEIFEKFNLKTVKGVKEAGKLARNLILKARFPENLEKEIVKNYKTLSKKYKDENVDVAVRSSATAEDLPSASFAGQHETFLNVRGEKEVLLAIKKCFASLFTDRAIAYREEKGFDHLKVGLSVGVQKMVRSDLASSGVMFTIDTESGFQNIVVINSIYGVGEMIVKGKITPDEFYVFKPTLKEGYNSIIVKNLGRKTKKYVYKKGGGLKEIRVPQKDQFKFSLTDDEILTLAKWGMIIEEHYQKPQDIEWAKDGKTGELFIVQSRPETVHATKIGKVYEEYELKSTKKPILTGIAVGNKIGQGKVNVIEDVSKINEFKKGEILVTRMTDPDWLPAMRMASAIVTDEGGRTCFSGDTQILTDKGFLSIREIVERIKKKEEIKTISLNRETLELEWKKIVNGFERKAKLIEIEISQTGRMKNNILRVTPDHRFLTFNKRQLISEEIKKLILTDQKILSVIKIPQENSINLSPSLGYLLGAISTDGYIRITKKNAQLGFIQQPTKEKEQFIETLKKFFLEEYDYNLHLKKKKPSEGIIRGKKIKGRGAIELACYKKEIAKDLLKKKNKLLELILNGNKEFILNFLAGVIDDDGSYNRLNRINIYCSKIELLKAIILSCLRLGINFQVTQNRTIFNVQIVDRVEEIFKYTKRVKGEYKRAKFGVRFFGAKQLLEDIIEKVNYKGRIRPYVVNNLLLDAEKIKNYIFPLIKGSLENHEISKILNSSLKMLRPKFKKELDFENVYNIEVEDNHNYIVFTSRYTPILVENCHAAIVSRELGIPCIVGTQKATQIFKDGDEITVDCSTGQGRTFLGKVPFEVKKYDLEKLPKLPVKICLNIGAPETAFQYSNLPVEGVGLAREEFIIAEKIRVHPLALYHYKELKKKAKKDKKAREILKQIDEITIEHKDKREHFIKELAEGIGKIGAAFWPKEVIVRFSDFKTNEYRALIGGELFEPQEENPMLGWRGASRYYDPLFQPAFEMECKAIKRAREGFALKNIQVMIPFCRTVEEGKKVIELMKKFGLERGKDGLKVYIMCEIPSNVILAEKFLEICDGFSIGSNDLTQCLLGIDRDNAKISLVANETHPVVKQMISQVIKVCKKMRKYSGICGDIPSTDINFARFLVKEEIEAISLSPDAVMKTIIGLSQNT